MIDRTRKREERERRERKRGRYPIHGRSLQHVLNAIRKRARRLRG